MIDNTWNTLGAPDVLPFGYGGTTGGGYGSLRMQDAPDYVTNRAPFRGPGGTSPMDRGGPNMPAYAPPIQETAGGVIPASRTRPRSSPTRPTRSSTSGRGLATTTPGRRAA